MNELIDLATYEELVDYLEELKLEYKKLEDSYRDKNWFKRYYKTLRSRKVKETAAFVDEKNIELINSGSEVLIDKDKSISMVKFHEKDYYKYIISEFELYSLGRAYNLESEIAEIESILSSVLRRVA